MQLTVRQQNENENVSQAPTLGGFGGVVTGQAGGQRGRGAVSGRGSGFTNLQSYIRANESNPNAQIIQQRTGQATEAQRQAQTGFETQAGQAKGRLQGIQEQAGVVRSALDDPTKFVQTPENIKRITALRTGQEAIANPTDIQQNVLQGAQGLQSQRGQLASALQRDVTGTGLQEYLRSQRVNPALATAGENRLDRFLAEQTASGQQAIGGAMTEAERIALLNQPEEVGQIGQLVSQVQAEPLSTTEGIQNVLSETQKAKEGELKNINKLYLATQLGLGSNINPIGFTYTAPTEFTPSLLAEPELSYVRPENRPQVTQERLNEAQRQYESYNDFQNKLSNINKDIENANRRLQQSERESTMAGLSYDIATGINKGIEAERLRNDIKLLNSHKQNILSQAPTRTELVPFYNQFLKQLGTREQVLQQYDPNQLARIRALQQITGSSFEPLLGGNLT